MQRGRLPWRSARILFAAALLTLASTAALATGSTSISLPERRAFTVGETIRVGWESLPAGVDELEFLLVRGDRLDEIVRLTPRLVPAHGSFDWKVPGLPSARAALRLRVGVAGEEIEVADSDSFTIQPGADGRAEVAFRDGEWWASDPMDPWSAAAPGSRARAAELHAKPLYGIQRFAALSRRPNATGAAREVECRGISSATAALSHVPLAVPQRK